MQYGSQPPASGGNNALVIGLVVGLVVLVLGGGAVGAFLYLNAPDPLTTVTMPKITTIPEPSEDTSDSPSNPPVTDEPTEPSATPTESDSPSAGADSPLSDTEFKDWDFKLGDVALQAQKVGGWTYDDCDPVDGKGGVLAKNDCEQAIELAYSARSGHVKAVQVIMAFPTKEDASATATRLTSLSSDAVKWRKDKTHSTYAFGKYAAAAMGKYVIYTVVTADNTGKSQAPRYLSYLQSDHANYFIWR
ncbi:hypothetical protein SAMN05421869_10368 [Nonomuraea jiangxiensis]|uniref:Uncharacterized protein n=1 Tax=Nonomuraea jiangxiensis TaxID=633440 RepID=A0A1G8EQB4_9ACTN|nr:hypothetical protein SAMN05421869_10368 [Nonomuraea jiangxiensis]